MTPVVMTPVVMTPIMEALKVLYPELNVLGPVPEVGVVAKRPQGLLNVGDSFRADGGAAFLRS
jgi:hypothetical protein